MLSALQIYMIRFLNRKFKYSIAFIILVIIAVFVFWKTSVVLTLVLILSAVLKSKIIPIKKEFLWFIISGAVGSLGESLIMTGGTWAYSYSDIFNFPLWLPFVWGLAGIVGISLYQGITETEL